MLCRLRLSVRTPGFHPGKRSSILLGDAILLNGLIIKSSRFFSSIKNIQALCVLFSTKILEVVVLTRCDLENVEDEISSF